MLLNNVAAVRCNRDRRAGTINGVASQYLCIIEIIGHARNLSLRVEVKFAKASTMTHLRETGPNFSQLEP